MENHQLEAIVAAILAAGTTDSTGTTPTTIVLRYRQVLRDLRKAGDISQEAP